MNYRLLSNLPALLAFDAVARHLSFSRAARDLHVTQGAVSHRIRGLEQALGVSLFIRSSRRVQLTEEGEVLHRATHDAFARLQRGIGEVESLRRSQTVVVSCSPSFAIRWLVPHLGVLHADSPDLQVHINANDRLVDPGVGSVDVCIRFGPGGYAGVQAERLTTERVVPVCSPRYAEELDLRVPDDLHRAVLLHDDVLADHPRHVGWTEWIEKSGSTALDPTGGVHFSHSHLALDAAAAGQGVALARRTLVRGDLASGRLVAPFSFEVPCGFGYWLITPRVAKAAPSVEAFRAWLRARLEQEAG